MSNRDEILANFQACTGIEDYGHAISFLESCNWDLLEAINKAMPDQSNHDANISILTNGPNISSLTPSLPSNSSIEQVNIIDGETEVNDIPLTNHDLVCDSIDSESFGDQSIPSTSKSNGGVLDINIKIVGDGLVNGNSFPLEIPATITVSELKTLLHQLVGVPVCNQNLEGFLKPVTSETVITKDILPADKCISLNSSSAPVYSQFHRYNGRASDDFTLHVHDEKNVRDYTLNYAPSKLVGEIKTDLDQLTGIPARLQLWTGWPPAVTDQSSLGCLGISKDHHLTVKQQKVSTPTTRTPKSVRRALKAAKNAAECVSDESSAEEFEDASELLPEDDFLLMCDVPPSPSRTPLIAPNIEDESVGALSFVENFQARFGPCVPLFFHGKLESAVKESVLLPAKKRKPLAVYLHHDKSVSANVFCSQALCHESVIDYLTSNFVIWGWDLTHESNKAMLLNLISSHFGQMASSTVRSYNTEKLPCVLIITRSRGSAEILSVIHGNVILDEMMTSLMQAHDIFEEQRRADEIEETHREVRETMMAEQDAAYHASLEADRAKELAKRKALDEEREKQEELERERTIREQEDAMKQAVRASLKDDLPPEPGPDSKEPTCALKVQVADGNVFSRLFTRSTRLQIVLNYLHAMGYAQDEFKYIQRWPRRCITTLDPDKTLEELQMHAQEVLIVEER